MFHLEQKKGDILKVSKQKLNQILAERCMSATDLRTTLSPATITRIRKGYDVSTRTFGRLAKALDVTVAQLTEDIKYQ